MDKIPPLDQLKGRTIGRILIKMGLLTREKVHHCLKVQQQGGKKEPLGKIFVSLGLVKQSEVNIALAAQRGMEYVDLRTTEIPQGVISLINAQMAKSYSVIPLELNVQRHELTVAIDGPDNFRATDDLSTLTGYKVLAKVSDSESIAEALTKYYSKEEESIKDIIDDIQDDRLLTDFAGRDQSIDLESIKEMAGSSGVTRLLNLVLLQAIQAGASDIHFEPFEKEYKMRHRIDGVLYEMVPPPKHVAVALSSRLKVMANLDIAERRMPQDGRIPLVVHGSPVDLRVSVLPTMFGESVVLRVLDRSQLDLNLDVLGFSKSDLVMVRQLVQKPNGVVVVCGPTGSGKTTTLYSALKERNTIDNKLITVENPVEYDIDGLIQVDMKPDIGLTFASCLRSILRQDPDIILVGEIRDLETAEITAQASLTGHLVLTTVHANDAPSVVARLLDLGMEPFLITATVEGVVAQRLVRKICANCKTAFEPTEEVLMELGLTSEDVKGKVFYYGKGCDICNGTGYRGRMGIFEIMTFDDTVRELIMKHASTSVLRAAARKTGMKLLRESGLEAVYNGTTTIDEVVRETIAAEE
jgi:type IV pilus assembly protein PilB